MTLLEEIVPLPGKNPPYANITYHTFTKLFIPKGDIYLHALLHMEEEQEQDMDLLTLEQSFLEHFKQSNEAIFRYHREQGHDEQPSIINCVLSNRTVPGSNGPVVFG